MVTQAARRVDGWLSGLPFHPWLFAAFPVVRLYAENVSDVDPGEVLVPLLVVLLATSAGMVVLSRLLREPRRAGIIVSAVLVPVLSFELIREALPAALGLQRAVLLALSAAGILVAVVVAVRIRGQLGPLTATLNALSAVLLILVAVPAARGAADVIGTREAPADVAVAAGPASATAGGPARDIFHLVLDRYGSERSFATGFGIDNGAFTDWLRDEGFQVIDGSHANYARTLLSLGATLGMAPLDDIAAAAGLDSRDMRPVVRRIKESRAGATLQALGYEYHHIGSWFDRSRDSRIADQVYKPVDALTFGSTLFDLTIVPSILGRPTGAAAKAEEHASAARAQWQLLETIRDDPGPKYVFAHILLPHPPFVFLEDGTFDPKAATLRSQLAYTNDMVRRFVEPLLALPQSERPIIILQADEGPYPRTKRGAKGELDWAAATGEDLVTKFGILDAWYLPGPEGASPLPAVQTAVNTYPELLRRYFGIELERQPDRIYASTVDRPYDMIDVTERIAATEAALASAAPTASQPGA